MMSISPSSPSQETASDPAGKIIQLRALLAQKFPGSTAEPVRSRLATGIQIFDRCLEGGLPKAALTEVICPEHGTGSATMIQALIESIQSVGKHLALVDVSDCFDPDGLTSEQLSALLWVRCSGVQPAIKALDLLCRDNNLPLLVLDLVMCSPRQVRAIPSTYWYRLQRVAEGNGSVTLVFTPTPVVGSAVCTVRLTRRFEFPALELLRSQLTARLQLEAVRTRASSGFADEVRVPSLLVG